MKPVEKYVLMRLQLWKNIEAMTPARQPVAPVGRSCGFLLVYDTLHALLKDFPDGYAVRIEPRTNGEPPKHL